MSEKKFLEIFGEFVVVFVCVATLSIVVAVTGCSSVPKYHHVVYDRDHNRQIVPYIKEIEKHNYNLKYLKKDPNKEFYYAAKGANFRVLNGVDVSRHQGTVDFQRLKDDGYEFVFIRLAFRRYGYESGNLEMEPRFDEYFQGAKEAGMKIGVYVFSQAMDEQEALEEAQIVIDTVKPEDLDLPVVFDPEFVFWDAARTDIVNEEQFNKNTVAFCEKVREAGFEPMIYANILWEVFVFTPEIMNKYDVWFAQYTKKPTSPYKFTFWQYSGDSTIPGSEKPCDMDLWFLPLED